MQINQIYPSVTNGFFALESLVSINKNLADDKQDLLEDQNFNKSEKINKQLTISYLMKLNNIIIEKIQNMGQLEINKLITQKQNVLNYLNVEVMPYFKQILKQFIDYQIKIFSKSSNSLIKDVIDMCVIAYQRKFEHKQIFHIKEILLLECLLIKNDAKNIILNQNQAALSFLQEKFSISDFQDKYFDQITLLYFEKMIQNYYEIDCLSIEDLQNSISKWSIEINQYLKQNNSKNYATEDQQIKDLIDLNKQIRTQTLQKYIQLQQQILKFIKNIQLIQTRLKGILIISDTEKTEKSIQEELLNVQYKSKKRFLVGLEKIYKFKLDFTQRDHKIAQLLHYIIAELEFQSNLYIEQLRANIFVDRVNLDYGTGSRTIKSKEFRTVIHYDNNGNSYTTEEEYLKEHNISYVTTASAAVEKSNIKIQQEMNLNNIETNIQNFINNLKNLIDQHRDNQLNIQKEIINLKNNPQFIESRKKSRERKKIFIGQDLQEIQDLYLENLKNIQSKNLDLKSRLDCLSYYFFPDKIYVLDLDDLQNILKQQNLVEYENLFYSIINIKLKLKDSCWDNKNDRINSMFLSYVDITDQFNSNQQLCSIILDHAVQSRADLAFNFMTFSEKDQIEHNNFFFIIKKFFVSQRYQLVSNYEQLDKIINQVMDQFQQQFNQQKKKNCIDLFLCKNNNFIDCQVPPAGCCCFLKTKYYISKIYLELMQKTFRQVLFDQIDQNYLMKKFIFEIDMKPGSNLEFYMRYLSLKGIKQQKKCCFCF